MGHDWTAAYLLDRLSLLRATAESLFPLFKKCKRLDRSHIVQVETLQLFGNAMFGGSKNRHLHRRARTVARQFVRDSLFSLLMSRQNGTRSLDDSIGKSGQPSDFDAVAAIGLAGLHFAKEDDPIACFLYGDVQVHDARQQVRQFG